MSFLPPAPTFGPGGVGDTDFASDPRLHFSKESNSWLFEDNEGNEMEWDMSKSAWVPVASCFGILATSLFSLHACQLDEEIVQSQQAAYSLPGVDENVCSFSIV
jgi:HIV Tat-specific factor 1